MQVQKDLDFDLFSPVPFPIKIHNVSEWIDAKSKLETLYLESTHRFSVKINM